MGIIKPLHKFEVMGEVPWIGRIIAEGPHYLLTVLFLSIPPVAYVSQSTFVHVGSYHIVTTSKFV
jgi:hypothetical protein